MSDSTSFFWYDLETSGIDPRNARIMQFAGQRTDMTLQTIGEPVNVLIRLTEDILPDPDAVLLTGITPQMTLADGVTEAEFLRLFSEEVATPGTIFVGYNSIRFDDEFIRFCLYRNFYDPYEWQWRDGRSRWDILDVIRMTRALRPEGINWPVDAKGKPTNRLELLTAHNGLIHDNAHDALSDVAACIALARLVRDKQPKLFDYLLQLRDKTKVAQLVTAGDPFVYTSGSYPSEFEKTTIVGPVAGDPNGRDLLVYDLRYDPTQYQTLTAPELAELWRYTKDAPKNRLPVRILAPNKCPAIAPLGVLDDSAQKRLQLDLPTIKRHWAMLKGMVDFSDKLQAARTLLGTTEQDRSSADVDVALYNAFLSDHDRMLLPSIRSEAATGLSESASSLQDKRLIELLPRYVARNFPRSLTSEQRENWESFRSHRLLGGGDNNRLSRFIQRLGVLTAQKSLTKDQRYLLEELQLYAESIMPSDAF